MLAVESTGDRLSNLPSEMICSAEFGDADEQICCQTDLLSLLSKKKNFACYACKAGFSQGR